MKHLPLLLLAATLGFAAEEGPRPPARPQGPGQEGRQTPRLPVQLSPDEQKRLHEAMEKAKQDPAVKEAHEQAAKAQQAAQEAQKKARELTEDAARKADPSVAPILEKIKKAMERRQPDHRYFRHSACSQWRHKHHVLRHRRSALRFHRWHFVQAC